MPMTNNIGERPVQRFPSAGRITAGGFLENRAVRISDPAAPDHGQNLQQPGRDDKGEPDYAPELVCRTYVGDSGARPLASTITFWESPDIWVVAPDGSDSPIAGEVNQVKVHVWNLGLAPAYGVLVELFWCNPAVGITLAQSSQIGTTQQIMLNAGEHRVLTFEWTPTFLNDGHECLVAQVYDPVADNLVAPFNPVQDRHVGQHNVNNLRAAPGQQLHLRFYAANLSPLLARSEIRIEAVHGNALQELALGAGREFLADGGEVQAAITRIERREARPTIPLEVHPAAAVFRPALEPIPQRLVRSFLEGDRLVVPVSSVEHNHAGEDVMESREADESRLAEPRSIEPGGTNHIFDLRPGQELGLTLTITLPRRSPVQGYHALRVIERAEGRITGGMTYLVRVDDRTRPRSRGRNDTAMEIKGASA